MSDSTSDLRLHLDTSLQIELQKVSAKAEPVREAISGYRFTSTSTYARKEFKRAWLQDLNLIYAKTRDCTQIGEVYERINNALWHPKVRRRLNRCMDAINAFLEPHPTMPIGVAVVRLRAHVAEAILGAFTKWERSVTFEYDGTECIRARERPSRAPDGSIDCTVRRCKPSRIQCRVDRFFDEHRTEFHQIHAAIQQVGDVASVELKETAHAIDGASKDAKHLCDSDNCSAMSDALIAMDGIDAHHFGANNPKEWNTIAEALGKPLVNPVAK
jgi:hypothetical protein